MRWWDRVTWIVLVGGALVSFAAVSKPDPVAQALNNAADDLPARGQIATYDDILEEYKKLSDPIATKEGSVSAIAQCNIRSIKWYLFTTHRLERRLKDLRREKLLSEMIPEAIRYDESVRKAHAQWILGSGEHPSTACQTLNEMPFAHTDAWIDE